MREPAPDYSSRQYERPNQPWVCGLASEGHSCPAGPTARGHCPALAECVPARDGDRWQCNRSPLRGGTCDEGPTPDGDCGRVQRCRPVRSLRAIRGRFVTACTLLTAGGLLILLSADWRNRVISPGPLARQHAQLLQRGDSPGAAETNCAACHSAAERSVAGWTATLVGVRSGHATQSQRCMECHDKSLSAEFAMAAHSLPPATLQKITNVVEKGSERFFQATERQNENSSDPFFACATCHGEHHGAEVELTAMSDAACQSCHQQRYESFAADHPDFGAWPYQRRTRIIFNHASHRTKHFAETKQAFDCRSCHLDDSTGKVQLLASYEAACAACHDEKIATSVAKGVPVFALPTLDVDALKAAGHDIGSWSEAATGDFDGRLPPIMKLVLAADPAAAQAIATLGADFEFFDIDPDDSKQLEACATLATAIKKLFADVSQRGPIAVCERLSVGLGYEVSDAQLEPIIGGLSADTVRGAVAAWFPGVDSGTAEWPAELAGLVKLDPPDTAGERSIAFAPTGVWLRDDATFSIRYRPAAHADPVLTGWQEMLASTPNVSQQPLALAMLKELSNPTAPGLCASCHSAEQGSAGQLSINWRAYDRTTEPRTLTKFSHGPHLLLPQLGDCTSCHAIDDSISTAASYTGFNPHRFVSEFAPLSKQQCVQCHTAKAAGDSCQQCHNYHVDGIESWRRR